jgi:hypothetical protein
MLAIGRAALFCLFGYLFAKNGGFARGIHSDSNLPASNFQHRDRDVASDRKRLRRASS